MLTVIVNVISASGGTLQIHEAVNAVLAEVGVGRRTDWRVLAVPLVKYEPGRSDIVMALKAGHVEADWIRFEWRTYRNEL